MQKNARMLRSFEKNAKERKNFAFFEKNACPTLPIAHSPPPPLIAGFMSVCIIFTQKMMFYCYLPTVEKDSYILKGMALQKKYLLEGIMEIGDMSFKVSVGHKYSMPF